MHQQGMAKNEQPLTEKYHQHSHKNKAILPETGQLLKPDGHQHEYKSQTILPKQPLNEAPHQHSHEHEETHHHSQINKDMIFNTDRNERRVSLATDLGLLFVLKAWLQMDKTPTYSRLSNG